jgi:hypothetical protein
MPAALYNSLMVAELEPCGGPFKKLLLQLQSINSNAPVPIKNEFFISEIFKDNN